ncbi:hypothetical protein ABID47_003017 [Paenibacillus favisporus]|uniref:Uncharacterized protein n=1 Tax=Paenibacillus favisporus TaxID=221028 RepID=A0ABV2F3R8_9BACL
MTQSSCRGDIEGLQKMRGFAEEMERTYKGDTVDLQRKYRGASVEKPS